MITAPLAFEAVAHRYAATPVLSHIDLALEPGEILCLLGPSGSGKSTLLRLAAGLEPLQQGRISIEGRVVASVPFGNRGEGTVRGAAVHLPPEDRRIGLVFQDFALFPHMTVARNIAFGLHGLERPVQAARVQELASLTGIADLLERLPETLSGGQQQRVALARALAPEPSVLLLDEPFSGLDPALRGTVRDQIRSLLREVGTTTLIVTHDAEEAMGLGDRLAVLDAGRLVQVGPPEALHSRPASPYVAGLFGVGLKLEAVGQGEGHAMTVFGAVPAEVPAGARVICTFRETALRPMEAGAGQAQARIRDIRSLGDVLLVDLDLMSPAGEIIPARARWQERVGPPGTVLGIAFDMAGVHTFPA